MPTSDKWQTKAAVLREKEKELQFKISKLEEDLAYNKTFQALEQAQAELKEVWTKFKAEALKEFIEKDRYTSVGKFGKITKVAKHSYKVSDLSKVPGKYLKTDVDLAMVKADIEDLDKKIPGIEVSTSYSLKITPTKEEEESN